MTRGFSPVPVNSIRVSLVHARGGDWFCVNYFALTEIVAHAILPRLAKSPHTVFRELR